MTDVKKPSKRIYLINRDFQLRYAFAGAIVGIISTLLTLILILVPLYQFEILRIPAFLPLPMLTAIGFAALANVILIGFLGIFITHRIAGPMYSLVRHLRKVELGCWAGHMRIRDNDDLRYLVRNFNQMVDGLVAIGRQDLASLNEIIQLAENMTESHPASNDLLSKLRSLKQVYEVRLTETSLEGVVFEKGELEKDSEA